MSTDKIASDLRTEDGDSTPLQVVAGVVAQPLSFKKRIGIDLLLVTVTMIWGFTFLVTQNALRFSGPFTYLFACFGIGAVVMAVVFRQRLRHLTRVELFSGMLLGLILFVGYGLQTTGLLDIPSSKSGFITGMYVPMVPFLSLFLLRQRPTISAFIGVVLSVVGLFLLSFSQRLDFEFGPGEALTLGCAVVFALQIVCISKYAQHVDTFNFTVVQLSTAALLDFVAIWLFREPLHVPPQSFWISILFMGLGDMCFCFLAMNFSQRYITSTRATLVYALEPVWAGFFGLLAGQMLSLPAWIGSACIILGMLVGGIHFRPLFRRRQTQRVSLQRNSGD